MGVGIKNLLGSTIFHYNKGEWNGRGSKGKKWNTQLRLQIPVHFMITVLLTIMASYTALDLLTTLFIRSRSINAYNIGSCRSKGLATWTLDFVDIFNLDNSILTAYNFSTIIFC